MEGTNGYRFVPKPSTGLGGVVQAGYTSVSRQRSMFELGDRIEAVGFAELGGPSPVLREALVRRLGHAPLPAALPLSEASLFERQHDATLVRVEASLVSYNPSDQVLELQAGTRGFLARLDRRDGLLPNLLPGSRLQLTGVFAGKGGDPASGHALDSFELLPNSPADIVVLHRPSWWTLRHTLTVVAAMALILFGALIWIGALRRQVEERSRQLTAEIQRREQTERQRALEQERARIARDLHDDLGATLTQIRFLSALESRDALVPAPTRSRMSDDSR